MDNIFAVRASNGLTVYKGVPNPATIYQQVIDPKKLREENRPQTAVKFVKFSTDGKYFAYCDGERLTVLLTETWKPYLTLDGEHSSTSAVYFSPQANFLCTWRMLYAKAPNQIKQSSNMFILKLNTKTVAAEFIDKSRQNWQPQWTDDETICARLVGSELLFHENNNFTKYAYKLVLAKMADFTLSRNSNHLHVAAYVPMGKDTPAVVKVYQYPHFQAVVNAKSFFKADRVSMQWNNKGSALVIMAITDIDSTGQSYYGEQNLYFVSTRGDSYMVPLAKSGPVYWVEWNPQSTCYCVVYGYMPAKATLYDLRGNVLYDFGTGPRNEAHYDPFGHVLCLCGFGNLRGNMEFFAAGVNVENQRLCNLKAEDTTLFCWSPDGQHFVTATTAPRLRVNNGWKIWRYDGRLVDQFSLAAGEELWEVVWCPQPRATAKPLLPCSAKASAAAPAAPHLPGVNSSGKYVPPHMRSSTASKANFKLHEYELPTNEKPGGGKNARQHKAKANGAQTCEAPAESADLDEADVVKRIRGINKKLEQIKLLKERLANGEKLELNQKQKVEKEAELLDELEQIKLK